MCVAIQTGIEDEVHSELESRREKLAGRRRKIRGRNSKINKEQANTDGEIKFRYRVVKSEDYIRRELGI
jgi:hypothetical protein